jgi:hypothetical protein
MQDYKTTLEHLVLFDKPLKETLAVLDHFDLSGENELVVLQNKDIISILKRFLQSELSAQDVNDWASALELRDDVKFGCGDSDIFIVIFKLATPELEGGVTAQRAMALIELLSRVAEPSSAEIDAAYSRL